MKNTSDKRGGEPYPRYHHKTGPILGSVLLKLGRKMGKDLLPQYQPATLNIEASIWRVVWYNWHPTKNTLVRVRKTFALNRIKDTKERHRVGMEYVNLINEALAKGWNYFTEAMPAPEILQKPENKQVTIENALAQALRIRVMGKSGRTVSSYASYVKTFTAYLTATNTATMPVATYTAEHYYDYLFYKEGKGHGNKNINESTLFLRSLFEIMRKNLKLLHNNPLADIVALPEPESQKFKPFTQEELALIVPALIAYSPCFYLYCKFIPTQYMRPHHIARLQSCDINYVANEIYLGGDTTKNKKNAAPQLMHSLKKLLLEMEYNKVPGNYYLFGKDFKPAEKLNKRLSITAAEKWREIVIDGLKIPKHMYALKHTSAQYFVNNNAQIDVYYLRQQLQHSSARETEIYLQKNVKKKVKDSDVKTLKF